MQDMVYDYLVLPAGDYLDEGLTVIAKELSLLEREQTGILIMGVYAQRHDACLWTCLDSRYSI